MYGIFEKFKFFFSDLADYYIIDAIVKALGKLPDTKANRGFNDAYIKRFGTYPNYWASFIYAGALLIEAAVKKAGTTENEARFVWAKGYRKLAIVKW
jgi:ABC-type branched-subunit amino acid transport system substrate-binding protein